MEKIKHDYHEGSQVLNKYGEWVPSICEPYYVGWGLKKAECWTCEAHPVFKDAEAYYGHYALKHILGL